MGIFTQIGSWITGVIQQMGLIGVAILVAFEKVFPPVPSELILPLAGYLSGRGQMSLPGVIIAATFGSVAGALILYGIAAKLGETRVRSFAKRYGRWIQLGDEDLDKADSWFDRHGDMAALTGPLVPLVRSAVSIPAGLRGMSVWKFAILTTIGSAVWNSILVGLGWWAGDRWHIVNQYVGYFNYVILVLIAGGIGWWIWKRRSRA
jgi:membrane protein DedA with SNARE-associated domain